MKILFSILFFLSVLYTQAQEYYHNEIFNQNLTSEICSDILVNESSYVVLSNTFIYSPDNQNLGDLIVLREFDFEGNLINSDSLEVFGCTVWSMLSDNVIKTNDGGYLLAWKACIGRLFKFNQNLQFEWEIQFEDVDKLFALEKAENRYLLLGQVVDDEGQGDLWIGFVDSLGNIESELVYGDEVKHDQIHWIEPTSDGGYLLSGGRYHTWNPLLVKIDSLGNVQWEKTYAEPGFQHGWGIARAYSDSAFVLLYGNAIEYDFVDPYALTELKLVLLNDTGEVITELNSSEAVEGLYVRDLKIVGEDIYCLFNQFNEPPENPNSFRESHLLKYNMNTGVVWERAYRGFSTSQDELSLMDLELIENPENEIEFLMAGFLYDYSLTGSLLQCTWVLGADCQGYSSTPELSIQTQVSDVQNPGDLVFENTGTQLDTLNWWFSTGEISNLQSPELTFENNGAYQVELSAPYCGNIISTVDSFVVAGVGIEEITKTKKTIVKTIDVLGRVVPENYKGQVIDIFDDGTVRKRYKLN